MLRKAFISFVATVALGAGIAGMTSVAEAKHQLGFFPSFGYHSDGFRSRADH